MLAFLFMSVLSTASAQEEVMDVAAPEPEGCWGAPASAVPAQDSTDVPLDISPRFFLDGRCAQGVDVVMADASGTTFDVIVDAQEHLWGTTVIVDPGQELEPATAYTLTITTESGTPTDLRFTTGVEESATDNGLTVRDVFADGACAGREGATFFLSLQMESDVDGLAGYAAATPAFPFDWIPVLVQNGRAEAWVTTDAQLGDEEACAVIGRLEDDGTIDGWQRICAPTPDIGECRVRRTPFGCAARPQRGADPTPMPLEGLLLLPVLGLFGLRRRRQA